MPQVRLRHLLSAATVLLCCCCLVNNLGPWATTAHQKRLSRQLCEQDFRCFVSYNLQFSPLCGSLKAVHLKPRTVTPISLQRRSLALSINGLPPVPFPGFCRIVFSALSWCFATTAVGFTGLLALILVKQYSTVMRHRARLPPVDLGKPILGHSINILKHGWSGGGQSWLRHLQAKHGRSFVFNLLFTNRVAIDYPLYEEHMQELERNGQLKPLFSTSMQKLLGKKSLLTLQAGRGGAVHAKVRRKIAPAFSTGELALMAPQVERMCRKTLEAMVKETADEGQTTLLPKTNQLTQDVAAASLLGSYADPALPHLARLSACIDEIIAGLFTIPVENMFGKPTLFGRALAAKKQACVLIDELMDAARSDKENKSGERDVLSQLAQETGEGEPLTAEEVQDTIATISFAGKVTAAAALPVAVVELSHHPSWIDRIARESPDFQSGGIEKPSAALQFIREAMRIKPPAAAFYRASDSWIDLGDHGAVPPGTPVAVCMDYPGAGLDSNPDEFNPERWTEEYARKHFIFFGGATPHSCPGRSLALLEMQMFLHLLCRDYDFEVLSEETEVDRAFTQVKYKDGLPLRISRKKPNKTQETP